MAASLGCALKPPVHSGVPLRTDNWICSRFCPPEEGLAPVWVEPCPSVSLEALGTLVLSHQHPGGQGSTGTASATPSGSETPPSPERSQNPKCLGSQDPRGCADTPAPLRPCPCGPGRHGRGHPARPSRHRAKRSCDRSSRPRIPTAAGEREWAGAALAGLRARPPAPCQPPSAASHPGPGTHRLQPSPDTRQGSKAAPLGAPSGTAGHGSHLTASPHSSPGASAIPGSVESPRQPRRDTRHVRPGEAGGAGGAARIVCPVFPPPRL